MKALFRKTGWIYTPSSVTGWVILLIYAFISVLTLIAIDYRYDSLTNSLIRFFPYFISYSVIYTWIASNTSEKKESE